MSLAASRSGNDGRRYFRLRAIGEHDKARRWLTKPKRTLAGRSPMQALETEAGARVVEEQLYRIDYGLGA